MAKKAKIAQPPERRKRRRTSGVLPDFPTELIDPELAQVYLDLSDRNRTLVRNLVARFVKAMKAGRWKITGESIKFNTKGVLIDGHHRLQAIIESGETIEIAVARNISEDAFMDLDTGRTRSPGDLLKVAGYDYTSRVASTIRHIVSIYEIESGAVAPASLAKKRVEPDDLLEWAKGFGDELTEAVRRTMTREAKAVCGPPSLFAALYFIFAQANKKGADEFFGTLVEGVEFEHGRQDPVFLLRRQLLLMKSEKHKKRPNFYKVALVIKAWNAFQDREPLTTMRYAESENFPEINRRRSRLAEGQAKKRRRRRAREDARKAA